MNQYGLILKEGRPELLLQGTPLAGKTFVCNPIDAANLSRKVFLLDVQAEEHLCFFALNIKGEVLGTFEIAHGTASGCMVTPREFLIRLLHLKASPLLNHLLQTQHTFLPNFLFEAKPPLLKNVLKEFPSSFESLPVFSYLQ